MSTVIAASVSGAIYLGETIRFYVTGVTDLNLNPINTPTTVQVDLIRATDGSHASGFPTTSGSVSDGQGQFHYDYNIAAIDITGEWTVLWKITNGSYVNESACNFAVNQFNGQLVLSQSPANPAVGITLAPVSTSQTTLNGTSGSVVSSQPFQAGTFKMFIAQFSNYANNNIPVNINYPVPFMNSPMILQYTNSIGVILTVTGTQLNIPGIPNGTPMNGVVLVIGA